MYWVNQKNKRYYRAEIVGDMFGECSIQFSWGGLNSNRGNGKIEPCECNKAALLRIEELKKERKDRGYSLIS